MELCMRGKTIVVITYCNIFLPLLLTVLPVYLVPLLTLSCVTGSPTPATTSQSYLSHAHEHSRVTVCFSFTPELLSFNTGIPGTVPSSYYLSVLPP